MSRESNSNSATQYLIIDQVRYGADSGPFYKPGAGAERSGVQDRIDDDRVLAPPDPAPAR